MFVQVQNFASSGQSAEIIIIKYLCPQKIVTL